MPSIAFVSLCIAWGGTWLAIKVGVEDTPPLWLAGTRFTVAGMLLLVLARFVGGWRRLTLADAARVAVMGLAAIGVCFGLIFWGEQYVASGLAGVLVQGFVPIGLFFFAATIGREPIRQTQLAGLFTGLVGMAVIMIGQATAGQSRNAVLGTAAIVVGTLVYDWAGVWGRPIFSRLPAPFVSGLENLAGGVFLLPVALVVERSQLTETGFMFQGSALVSWLYLVVIGSVIGFTAYTYLLGAWGPTRTSAYAFVTPVVALGIGVFVAGERLHWQHVVGALLILASVALVMGRQLPVLRRRVVRAAAERAGV